MAFDAMPDLGMLHPEAIAAMRPPRGESFDDVCARCQPALAELVTRGGRLAVVAHAGIVRAALAAAMGSRPAALAFQVAPWSLTHFTVHDGRDWSINTVNWLAQDAADAMQREH